MNPNLHGFECCEINRYTARLLTLPIDANPDKVSVEFKDGAPTVHLVKDKRVKPPQIAVKIP
jgi:hypothetical protein